MNRPIAKPFTLPCGLTVPNRLVKAAMSEGIADRYNCPTERHVRLYGRWAKGGIGLQLTGNVQVDRDHLERPGNVVIDEHTNVEDRAMLERWARSAKVCGSKIIMQISHAGRQTPSYVNETPGAPSAVEMAMPGGMFGAPREMSHAEIERAISGYREAARVAAETGFDGVQVHGAHGYLVSQFLSPRTNKRNDQWGGTLENRARFLLATLSACKEVAPPGFAVGVKLNSSDFQKGGFTHDDCLAVIDFLNALGIDFVEISGGNYEQPALGGIEGAEPSYEEAKLAASTRAREAYFASYARSVQAKAKMPLLVTGGFRNVASMDATVEAGDADLIGIGRPLCGDPDLPLRLLSGEAVSAPVWEKKLSIGPGRLLGPNSPINLIKGINSFGQLGWFSLQIQELADGRNPDLALGVLSAFRRYRKREISAAHALLDIRKPSSP